MLKPGGYAIAHDFDGRAVEFDTMTCAHCNSVKHIPARSAEKDLVGFCRCCMKPICQQCVGKTCTPFERKLEQIEARDIARRSYGI